MWRTYEGKSSETERKKQARKNHFRREGKIGVENEEANAVRERAERES